MVKRFDPALLPPQPNLDFEQPLWAVGIHNVAGIDEAGRGSLAGPVAAAVVILPARTGITRLLVGVRDSKQMTAASRERWAQEIKTHSLAQAVGFASAPEIDELGILPATHLAVKRALQLLSLSPQHLLCDYLAIPNYPCPQTSLIKGDARSLSIAAASILAKTARDALMRELDVQYPGYGFAAHKGYGTRYHLQALTHLGPSPVHRLSFKPLSQPPHRLTP